MTITCDVSPKEFEDLKGSDTKPPRNFIIVKENPLNEIGDEVVVQEKNETGYTGKELRFEITYILGDHTGLKKENRVLGLKLKNPS